MGLLADSPIPSGFTGTRLGVCNLCEAICGLRITFTDGAVTGVRGNPDDPLSRGYVCPKGVSLADVHADPDRLRRPVRRLGDGPDARWEELGWEEALDLVADRIAAVSTAHGRDAVGVYLGNPNAHSLGSATHGTAFVRSLRTRNRFSASSVDQWPHQLLAWRMFGHQLLLPVPDIDRTDLFLVVGANPMASNGSLMTAPDFPNRLRALQQRGGRMFGHQLLLPVPDIDRTDLFLVVGANPMASNGSLMTAPDFPNRLRALQQRGGRMVVVDPRRTETAKAADEHLFVRPGSDAALLLALVHVLLRDDLTSPPTYVDRLDDLPGLVADFTPELAERVSGVPAAEVERLARELATAERAAVYGRLGVSTHGFGSICLWAVNLLNILTGNLDREGGVMFPEPAIDTVGRRIVSPGHHDVWRSRVRGLPEFAGELPVSVLREEIETPGEGQVRALVTIAGNPVLSTPDGRGLARALDSLDFMVAIDIYLNETTRHADVVLPVTTALERDHYDLVFHGLAVRNTARFTPALLPKEEGTRHDWQVFAALAARLSSRMAPRAPLRARLAQRVRLGASPRVLLPLLLRGNRYRLGWRALRRSPQGVDLGPLRPCLPGRLQTADKRIDLTPALVVDDLERLRASLAQTPPPDPDELLLIGRRHSRDNNSWMHNTTRLTRGKPRHHLLVHPDDLAERGLADGDLVTVSSRVGEVTVECAATEDVMPGVVSLPHGYGHALPGVRLGVAAEVPGVSINDLTDPERLDVSGNAALNGTPVRIAPAPAPAAPAG